MADVEAVRKALDVIVGGLRAVQRRTDASTVMVGAAILDNGLESAIATRMPGLNNRLKQKLFEGYGPLATFAAKIDVALAFGLVDVETHKKLHVVKRVRNEFAHSPDTVTFESQEIVSMLTATLQEGEHADAQTQYLRLLNEISVGIKGNA